MQYDYHPPAGRHSPARRGPSILSQFLPVLLLVCLVALLLWWLIPGQREGPRQYPDAAPRPVAPRGEFTPEEQARIALFKEVKDSVVNVDTLLVWRESFRLVEAQTGTGSGFVWDEHGHIVTNFHVIQEAVRRNLSVRVTMADQSKWNARLMGAAPEYDLAVLQIDAPADKLKPIKIGTSADLQVGQDAFAIGNPFGQELTLTFGIISATDREIMSPADRPIVGVIQTDAALNPGNSGGPLLDRWGRLIGVNTAITSPTGGNVGIGYAIPVDTVNEVVPQLIRQERVTRPTLGIEPLSEVLLRNRLGIDRGVMVRSVVPNGPADKAGLLPIRQDPRTGRWRLGDLILAVNGEPVNGIQDLNRTVARYKVGQTVTLTIQRDDEVRDVPVTLEGV